MGDESPATLVIYRICRKLKLSAAFGSCWEPVPVHSLLTLDADAQQERASEKPRAYTTVLLAIGQDLLVYDVGTCAF